uniref:Uncharacterized protein n=1 Tax=Malurus cyaneus samueli TaxID=2593467 RepID=A0A8C5X918_9PASS
MSGLGAADGVRRAPPNPSLWGFGIHPLRAQQSPRRREWCKAKPWELQTTGTKIRPGCCCRNPGSINTGPSEGCQRAVPLPVARMWLYAVAALLGLFLLRRWHRERQTVPGLSEKHVLITGCDSGFGNLLARQLDARGLRVLAACLTETGAAQLRAATSSRLQTVLLDVTSSKSIADVAAWVRERVGDQGRMALTHPHFTPIVTPLSPHQPSCHFAYPGNIPSSSHPLSRPLGAGEQRRDRHPHRPERVAEQEGFCQGAGCQPAGAGGGDAEPAAAAAAGAGPCGQRGQRDGPPVLLRGRLLPLQIRRGSLFRQPQVRRWQPPELPRAPPLTQGLMPLPVPFLPAGLVKP